MAKKLNHDEKRALQAAKVAEFMREYGRKKQKGGEPNDRRYDRELEFSIKQLRADELDRLLREDEDAEDR